MTQYISQKKKGSSLSILFISGVKPYECALNEGYMNITQIEHFKRILLAWRDKIRLGIKRSSFVISEEIENYPDPVDRAVQEEEFSLELRNRDREYKLIKKIENTINRIEKDSFGFCASCDAEIGIRRLEANPIADLCIDCKTLSEMREKQMIGGKI